MAELSLSDICLKGVAKSDINMGELSNDIAKHQGSISLKNLAVAINAGYTFCPCTFIGTKRQKNLVKQMQLFVLDFDGPKGTKDACVLSFDSAMARAKAYDLPVVIAYETMSSVNFGRYRLVFEYNEPVFDNRMMELINRLLLCVFPEADQSTSDLSKMYLPGSNVHIFDESFFYIDSLAVAAETETKRQFSDAWRGKRNAIVRKTHVAIKGNNILIGSSDEISAEEADFYPVKTFNFLQDTPSVLPENAAGTLLYNKVAVAKTGKNMGVFFYKSKPISVNPTKLDKRQDYNHSINLDTDSSCPCALLQQFTEGERLEHQQWWGLMLNLIYINKGQTLFKNTLTRFSDRYGDIEHKFQQMRYCISQEYSPMSCINFCPYADKCPHSTNVIQTLHKAQHTMLKLKDETIYTNLDSVQAEIKHALAAASKQLCSLSVIKTQTGTGKTTAALNFIQQSERRVIMAFPNVDLMYEMYTKAQSMGIDINCTPTIQELRRIISKEQWERINRYYENGAPSLPIKLLSEYIDTNKAVKDFLDRYDRIKDYKGHLFTTHARLLTMNATISPEDIIIIDEDIVQQCVSIKSITLQELTGFREFAVKYGLSDIADKLQNILCGCEDNTMVFYTPPINLFISQQEELIQFLELNGITFNSCIIGALSACWYHYDARSETFFFTIQQPLSPFGTYIMMSATANETICREVFSNLSVSFHECSKVRYKGKAEIYADKSYSHHCLHKNDNILHSIVSEHPDDCFITFKEAVSNIDVPDDRKLYFGKAMGTNTFSGKDITIIGTPNKPEFVYHLLSYEINHKAFDNLAVRRITYAGYEFSIMTFQEDFLREIQLYLISTELEQAVGRARLIHNDCTVRVYSGFPVEQGVIKAT